MIENLHIDHFAIADNILLELGPGLNVLSGETGAGKSIVVDALSAVLGARVEKNWLQEGQDKAEVTLTLSLAEVPDAAKWLAHHDLDADDECIVRRVIPRNRSSKSYINGSLVNAKTLRAFAEELVQVHGQHEHQRLLNHDYQLQQLDRYGKHKSLTDEVENYFDKTKEIERRIAAIESSGENAQDRIELLRYQVEELDQFKPVENELIELEREHNKLSFAREHQELCQQSLQLLGDQENEAATTMLYQALQHIDKVAQTNSAFANVVTALSSAHIQLSEAESELQALSETIEVDDQQLADIETRLETYYQLARKHQTEAKQLFSKHQQLVDALQQLESATGDLAGLKQALQTAKSQYHVVAEKLSAQRKKTSKLLSKKVTTILQTLGIDKGEVTFSIDTNHDVLSKNGFDRIQILFAPNPGRPATALKETASGGELSRVSLAIQSILVGEHDRSTLVFDEVDAGIGGTAADSVGQRLKGLAHGRQVLCITHLPQVASYADQHFQVKKSDDSKTTHTQVSILQEKARVDELARMLAGEPITTTSRAHARELIARARKAA